MLCPVVAGSLVYPYDLQNYAGEGHVLPAGSTMPGVVSEIGVRRNSILFLQVGSCVWG